MNPQVFRGFGEIPAMALEHPCDETLLELSARLDEQDSLVDHLGNQRFQLLLHGMTPPLLRGCPPNVGGEVIKVTALR